MRGVRILAEIFGVAFFVATCFACYVLLLGGGLVALWGLLVGGLALLVVLFLLRRRWLRRGLPYRALFDLWLGTLLPAALLTTLLVQARWPLRTRGWDGHGMGATGGEINVLLLSWLHAALLLALALAVSRKPS